MARAATRSLPCRKAHHVCDGLRAGRHSGSEPEVLLGSGFYYDVFKWMGVGDPPLGCEPKGRQSISEHGGVRMPIAPHAFVAHLPKRLLVHPKGGGALAVVGHVERA